MESHQAKVGLSPSPSPKTSSHSSKVSSRKNYVKTKCRLRSEDGERCKKKIRETEVLVDYSLASEDDKVAKKIS